MSALGRRRPISLSEGMQLRTNTSRYKKCTSREHEGTLKTSCWWLVVKETGGAGAGVVGVVTKLRAG